MVRNLLASVSLLAVMGITPAAAQTAAAAKDADPDEIIVTGFRKGEAQAVEAKRETFMVSDLVVSDDIGRLPDQNTAAALRRIPGVSVQEDQNEPRFPSIRGLPPTYNRTQINGSIVASGDNGGSRTVPLDTVPSTLASRLEVFKTILPEMDPNAVGGTINIVTKSAFSEDGFFANATGAITALEQTGEIRSSKASYRGNALVGGRFGADGQFGIVASVNHAIRDYDITQFETATPSFREYTATGAPVEQNNPAGNNIPVPIQERLFLYNNVRERTGGALSLEWQANPELYFRAFGTYNRFKDEETRQENRQEQTGSVTNQTATTGTFLTGRNRIGLNLPTTSQEIWNSQFNMRWDASERLRFDLDAIYSGAQGREIGRGETFQSAANTAFGFTYDTSRFFFDFNPITPASLANPALHPFLNRTESLNETRQDIYEIRSNLTWKADTDSIDYEVKVGGIYRQTDHDRNADQTTFTVRAGSGLTYTLASAFDRRNLAVVGNKRFDLIVDPEAAQAFFETNRASFNAATNNITGDFTITEKNYGGFAQVSAKTETLQVIGGVRFERTDVNSASVRTIGAAITPANASGGYNSWLPSLHVRWEAAPSLVLRAAWTNTIGRPNFGDVTAREVLDLVTGAIPTLNTGNPDLQPRRSMGLDASAEYYTSNGGLVSLGLFYKRIKGEIYSVTSVETIDLGLGRGAERVEVSRPDNAQSASLFGVEAAIQQSLTFLPKPFDGLGLNLNATYVKSRLDVLTAAGPRRLGFFLQPEFAANATIFYELGAFEGRLAYNYTGEFLETVNATIPETDQFWRWRGTLDAQLRFRLSRRFELFVEGENLTNSGRIEVTGPNRDLLQEAARYGRAFNFGASIRY